MALGGPITDIFVGGENAGEVVHIGRQLLFVFAFAMPGLAVSLTLGGALRGAGDTRAVLLIMAGTTWIVRLVPAYLLAITFRAGGAGGVDRGGDRHKYARAADVVAVPAWALEGDQGLGHSAAKSPC